MAGRSNTWDVRPNLLLTEVGLESQGLVDRLFSYASTKGVGFRPSSTTVADGTALSIGGTFTLRADTPGAAVDTAVEFLYQACAELGIPVGEIGEIVVERADVDPREADLFPASG
ncbi:hypothetical protein ABZ746_35115 [Streptomyces sp. NPDC020096]